MIICKLDAKFQFRQRSDKIQFLKYSQGPAHRFCRPKVHVEGHKGQGRFKAN